MFRSVYRVIKIAILLLILLAVIIFAVSNRQEIMLSLFPLPFEVGLPLYLFFLVTLLIGYMWGLLSGSVASLKHRRNAKSEHKKAKALQDEVATLRVKQNRVAEARTTATPLAAPAAMPLHDER